MNVLEDKDCVNLEERVVDKELLIERGKEEEGMGWKERDLEEREMVKKKV